MQRIEKERCMAGAFWRSSCRNRPAVLWGRVGHVQSEMRRCDGDWRMGWGWDWLRHAVEYVYNLRTVRRGVSCRDGPWLPVCCGFPDLPGGVRNRKGGERAAARAMDSGAVGRRRELHGLAVLRDDGQRLLERVRRRADDRRAALHDWRRSSLFVGVLASQPSRERRGNVYMPSMLHLTYTQTHPGTVA